MIINSRTETAIRSVRQRLIAITSVCLLMVTVAGCGAIKPRDDQPEKWPVERLYSEAKATLADNDYEQAIELYQLLESRFPYGQYAEQTQLELAYAHYKLDQRALASAAVEQFIQVYPTHTKVDYAYYLRGLINFNEDDSFFGRLAGRNDLSDRDPENARKAFEAFRELVTRFPESRYVNDASRRMSHLLNAMATHDVRVAEYYMRRGAWVAVINRCRAVIETYEQTPAVEHALGMMAIAYGEMGMTDLLTDTRDVLQRNFPNSDYLARLQ